MPTGYTKATATLECRGSTKQQSVMGLTHNQLNDLEERVCCPGHHRGAQTPPPAPCNSKTGFGVFSQFSQSCCSDSVGKAAVLEPFLAPSAVFQASQSSGEGYCQGQVPPWVHQDPVSSHPQLYSSWIGAWVWGAPLQSCCSAAAVIPLIPNPALTIRPGNE